jgi:hypothetical protein
MCLQGKAKFAVEKKNLFLFFLQKNENGGSDIGTERDRATKKALNDYYPTRPMCLNYNYNLCLKTFH